MACSDQEPLKRFVSCLWGWWGLLCEAGRSVSQRLGVFGRPPSRGLLGWRAAPGPALTVSGPTGAAAWKGKSVAHPTPQAPPGEALPTTASTFFAAPTDMRVQTHTHTQTHRHTHTHTRTHPLIHLSLLRRRGRSTGARREAFVTKHHWPGFEESRFKMCVAPRGIPPLSFLVNT